jgi:hypothetical protein
MALVDNQNDRPVSGNQIIISRMFVRIVNTHWASLALSASCMGASPSFSSCPFVQPSASAFIQPSGLYSDWLRSKSYRQLHPLLIARLEAAGKAGIILGDLETSACRPESRPWPWPKAPTVYLSSVGTIAFPRQTDGFEILPIVVVVAHRHDSTVPSASRRR